MPHVHLLAGLCISVFGGASLLMPQDIISRLERPAHGHLDGFFGQGAFVMLHRVLSIVVILFGMAVALSLRG